MPNLPLYIYFIAFSFLVSIATFKYRPKGNYMYTIPFFLLITLLLESYSLYLWNQGKENLHIYNFFTAFEFSYYLFLVSRIIENVRIKKFMLGTFFLYPLIALLNILFIQKNVFHSITYSLGCLLVVAGSVYYFFELFQQPKSSSLLNEPAFWICTGLLFYYSCSFPLMGAINFIKTIPIILLNNAFTLLNILNILLYSLFTIAFLCQLKTRRYTLS